MASKPDLERRQGRRLPSTRLTINPARILGIDRGTLRPGAEADVIVIDPAVEWTIDPSMFRSKSRNCPFNGWKVRGRAAMVIVGGEVKC